MITEVIKIDCFKGQNFLKTGIKTWAYAKCREEKKAV